ncbi:motility associated factor glycosyltransferase family protein [Treponema parvum]|uniref:Motility associated factor glycosyltransferase family protein n=1 Tax=Treponema parvum TaxID=138851 RepID=A0A975F0B6_9SPIR|nr:6-hydroxymethylpterin diphosphokinase MptE-like protein [Treponema parvum]QTQ11724.1 motility associated factor glycosyltransferase family protein [Treponema parvum]
MNMLYEKIIEAKNSLPVPVFFDGRPMHSKYDPEAEAHSFTGQLPEKSSFVVILGIGGGYHIRSVLERFPGARIIAVENSAKDISFISKIPCVQDLMKNGNVIFCAAENGNEAAQLLKTLYIPALHKDLNILIQRAWGTAAEKKVKNIISELKKELSSISADYSVQSHFGKIWQYNIVRNLLFLNKALKSKDGRINEKTVFPVEKTAAVVAAGPSLDDSVKKLKMERKNYYIISTDTALGTLLKHNIKPDAVVSIDGQFISHAHFMLEIPGGILFVFDVCASPCAVRRVYALKNRILFVRTGHPMLSSEKDFMNLETGAGTVTIAAADFAAKAGFSNIEMFGADFAYISGKPYARGTYLESGFYSQSYRLCSAEQRYCALMFRTPLIPDAGNPVIRTTQILNSYKNTFRIWKEKLKTNRTALPHRIENPQNFDFSVFMKHLSDRSNFFAFLPFIAFLRKNPELKDKEFDELLKLAQTSLLRYNYKI